MQLRDLLPDDAAYDARFAALRVGGVTMDSRKVRPGDIFVAIPGTKADGLQYVAAATAAGAAAVLAEQQPPSLSSNSHPNASLTYHCLGVVLPPQPRHLQAHQSRP